MEQASILKAGWVAPLAWALMVCMPGCASPGVPPTAQMDSARTSIAQAETAGAADKAPVDLQAARDKFSKAEAAANEKRFDAALLWSEQAEADADLAQRKARAVRAQAAATELARGNDTLRQELERKTLR